MGLATPQRIRRLQRKLYIKAKDEPAYRFYSLYDKIWREDILRHAYAVAKSRKGAPGVDGVTFARIEEEGVSEWISGLQESLRTRTYRPQPVRRVYIPKPNGGQRPLGIPTIRDRVVQTAAVLVLLPIFDAGFAEEMYGYRPRRKAQDAVAKVHAVLMVGVTTRQELRTLLAQDLRKVLITTIHKFAEAGGRLNQRSNIIVMVDEAHRTQEGDLGRKMREALPNAFLFGLTGTPINRADRNTFRAFGADEDEHGYLSRYSFQESIRVVIDEAYKEITGNLSEQDRDGLAKRAAKMAVLVKNPERLRAVVQHIVAHFQQKVEPNGFKAQVVVFDRECCVLYKQAMDKLIGSEASAVVMTSSQGDPPEWKRHVRDKDAEEKLLDRFRDQADPLQFVIVTSKLLTGFDAPILQVMYLDKPMKDHNLLQAICRTNRTFGQEKTHGLIVDYIGIFDDVARALNFDEKAGQQVVSNIDELRKAHFKYKLHTDQELFDKAYSRYRALFRIPGR